MIYTAQKPFVKENMVLFAAQNTVESGFYDLSCKAPEFDLEITTNVKATSDRINGGGVSFLCLDYNAIPLQSDDEINSLFNQLSENNIPVIFLIDNIDEAIWVFDRFLNGVYDFMLKPLEPILLRTKINLFM